MGKVLLFLYGQPPVLTHDLFVTKANTTHNGQHLTKYTSVKQKLTQCYKSKWVTDKIIKLLVTLICYN